MNDIKKMFSHKGKSSKLIGNLRSKVYEELYNHISEKQKNKELDYHGDYLGDNELAKNIYTKKYFLKDFILTRYTPSFPIIGPIQ